MHFLQHADSADLPYRLPVYAFFFTEYRTIYNPKESDCSTVIGHKYSS